MNREQRVRLRTIHDQLINIASPIKEMDKEQVETEIYYTAKAIHDLIWEDCCGELKYNDE